VLLEGVSKRSKEHLYGRSTQNAVVIVPKRVVDPLGTLTAGQFVRVRITSATSGSLQGEVLEIIDAVPAHP
jgi:tRNA-2-methylthio-N6-dimethylallyladenosine synthase